MWQLALQQLEQGCHSVTSQTVYCYPTEAWHISSFVFPCCLLLQRGLEQSGQQDADMSAEALGAAPVAAEGQVGVAAGAVARHAACRRACSSSLLRVARRVARVHALCYCALPGMLAGLCWLVDRTDCRAAACCLHALLWCATFVACTAGACFCDWVQRSMLLTCSHVCLPCVPSFSPCSSSSS